MPQLNFDDIDKPKKRRQPDTSREAWRKIYPELNRLQFRVLNFMRQHGGPVTSEVAISYLNGMVDASVRTRLNELVTLGYLRIEGTKLNSYGNPMRLYHLTERGKHA